MLFLKKLAAGVITVALILGVVLLTVLLMLHTGVRWIQADLTPTTKSAELIAASVESLHRKVELVVAQLHVTATVHLAQSTHWAGIYWGTTTADVTAMGNRVQYVDQFAALTAKDFTFNAQTNTLTCLFPPPVVDTSLVQVQPDPAKIIVHGSNGWALFNKGSLERKAKDRLRGAILAQAHQSFLVPLVRAKARQTLEHFVALVVHSLNPAVHVRVRFGTP